MRERIIGELVLREIVACWTRHKPPVKRGSEPWRLRVVSVSKADRIPVKTPKRCADAAAVAHECGSEAGAWTFSAFLKISSSGVELIHYGAPATT